MSHPIKSILAATCTAALLAQGAWAQETAETESESAPAADPSQVVATVNGTEITLAHVIALRATLPQQYDQFPPNLLLQGIVDQLIQHTLLKQSLDGEPSLRSRVSIENEERAIIAGEVMAGVVQQAPSDEDVQAAYEEQYPADVQETEYRASHILVETEEEAQELVTALEGDADFAALAREKSTGPSGASGGDLGWFGAGDMVATFFDAVAALEPGEISEPVKTEFGWHVITLVETRNKERPALDTVRAELEAQLKEANLESFIESLKSDAEIDQVDLGEIDPNVITNLDLLEN
ncbi:peptidylprolyl isomerase [Roseovarius atlanticus]|uniref:Parvulin-like PPIase n=1 Tax=Roseovarius atlanticus TaxID=1641875 RepID=A0A0T5NQN1_9RHOB|nr:peptidylprolyl isomerase [Roseovarius atlanticus]KRS11261.1 peptidylprolyl isomerase [Roseovarius atlanticus]